MTEFVGYATPEDRGKCAYYPLRFWQEPRLDRDGGIVMENGNTAIDDWCELAKYGDPKTTMRRRIDRLKLPAKVNGKLVASIEWVACEKAYNAWKSGQEEPIEGTPLSVWPGVKPWDTDKLKTLGIRTVEQVAGMNDADCDRFGMGSRAIVAKARQFVANKPSAEATARVVTLEQDNETLKKQLEVMQAQIAELATKRGPGRPRKEEQEAA